MVGNCLIYFEKPHLYVKTALATFWTTWATFYSTICSHWSLGKYLCAKPLVASVNDALEWFVASVIGDVLLQPRLGGGALAEYLAAFPEALEPDRGVVTWSWALVRRVNSLEERQEVRNRWMVVSQV